MSASGRRPIARSSAAVVQRLLRSRSEDAALVRRWLPGLTQAKRATINPAPRSCCDFDQSLDDGKGSAFGRSCVSVSLITFMVATADWLNPA